MPPIPPSPRPIPGVSAPAPGGGDRLSQLAESLGGMQGESAVTAADKIREALQLLREAVEMDPAIQPLVQQMLQPIVQGIPPGPPGGMQGPVPPTAGMPQGPMPFPMPPGGRPM